MPNFVAIGQTVVEISWFWMFQDGGSHNFGFLKFYIFNSPIGQEERTASLCQILSKLLKPWWRYVTFGFFKMAAAAILDFLNSWNGPERWTASLCQISPKSLIQRLRYGDFSIFQDGGCRHLGFGNFTFLTVTTVKRVELRHHAKFCRNRSYHGRDMVIFGFFKIAAAAILDFRNFEFLPSVTSRGSKCIIVPNFVNIALTTAKIWQFFYFSKMAQYDILDLCFVHWDHPWSAFDGLCHFAKFGWNRCSSFDNMHIFRFHDFGLKTPIHAPKLFFGGWPLNGEPCEKIHKRHILARVRVVWAIMRENPSRCLTCRCVPQKKGINKNNFGYISPMCPDNPLGRICT